MLITNGDKRVCGPSFSASVVRFTLIGTLRSLPTLEATIVARGIKIQMALSPSIHSRSQSYSNYMTENLGESLPDEAPAVIPGRQ